MIEKRAVLPSITYNMSSNSAISLPPSSLPVILATAPASPEPPPPPVSSPPPPPPVIPPPSPSPPLLSPPPPVILTSPPPPTPVTPPSPSPPLLSPPLLSPPPPVILTSPPPPSPSPPLLSPPPPVNSSPPPPTPVRSSPPPPPPPPPPSPQSPSSSSNSSLSIPMVAGISAGAVIILVAAIACFLTFCRKKARPSPRPTTPPRVQAPPSPPSTRPILPPFSSQTLSSSGVSSSYDAGSDFGRQPSPSPSIAVSISTGTFTYEEMAAATNGFSDDNLLGQGGFGHVYRGTLNGMDVAIKKLRAGSGQGDREFHAEVEIISRVHHKNLVSLVGFCIAGDQRLLAYEYVPNKTLEFHLHESDRTPLDWPRRWKIALTSAKGLAYLHDDCHPKIIHRDIKTANILLDFNFEAKVADFGLAKIQSGDKTQVSTRIMGTFGYLAPEYASSGKVTYRSDVFSYGVVLLELISGRRPVQSSQSYMDETLVGWAKPLIARAFEEDNYEDLVDPRLGTSYDSLEMARLIECAAAATRHSATHRPRMSQIIRYLEGEIAADDLNAGIKPGQSSFHGTRSSAQDSSGNQSEIRRFKKLVFGSQEYTTSSEYSEPTSEYGLNQTTSSSGVDTVESEPRGRWRKDK